MAAALVAAGLVLAASFYTQPVSTTQVSTGAIVSAGLRQGKSTVEKMSAPRVQLPEVCPN